MVRPDVPDDGRRVLRVLLLLYSLHHRAELLAHQPVRRGDHQHVLSHPIGYPEECLRSCAVRPLQHLVAISTDSVHSLTQVVDENEEGWSMVDGRRVAGRNKPI